MRMELHDKGLVLSAPEISGEPSEAVRRASGGPCFSVLPEKIGEKRGAWLRLVLSASEFRREPIFQASFHTIVTLRASWYAPPDTGVPNLQLVAVEYLPSIEGTLEIQMDVTFLRGKAPLPGELSAKLTERLHQICHTLSVSASPSHLPFQGRLGNCALQWLPL